MKDFTTLKKNDNGGFTLTRTISEVHTEEEINNMISNLEHSVEQSKDIIEVSEVRLAILREALEKGYAEGDTSIAPMKAV
jgi:hypothetical protein